VRRFGSGVRAHSMPPISRSGPPRQKRQALRRHSKGTAAPDGPFAGGRGPALPSGSRTPRSGYGKLRLRSEGHVHIMPTRENKGQGTNGLSAPAGRCPRQGQALQRVPEQPLQIRLFRSGMPAQGSDYPRHSVCRGPPRDSGTQPCLRGSRPRPLPRSRYHWEF